MNFDKIKKQTLVCFSEVTNDEISISNALESNDEDDTEPTKQSFNPNRNLNNNNNNSKNVKPQAQLQTRQVPASPQKQLQPPVIAAQPRSPFQYSEDDLESVTYVPS